MKLKETSIKWIGIILLCALLIGGASASPEPTVFYDDFGTNTGMWSYIGSAYRDATNGYVVLTNNVSLQAAGIVWFNQSINSNFTVDFRYKAGGGSGGDGLVLMFYKNKNYSPQPGGYLGFVNWGPVIGYGIEFDSVNNWGPSEKHIALIKDDVVNHLIYVNDSRTEDFIWHDVRITVNRTELIVYLDGAELFSWYGTFDRTYSGFGFAGATGDLTNWHLIDDVNITYESSVVPTNLIGYSALVATGQNIYVQSSNGTFGLLLKGQSKTINNSVILNNTGDISATVEARFNDSRGGVFGLVSGANVLNATNFALGSGILIPLNSLGANVQVAVAPPGVTALDARLGVPNEQAAGDYSGTVVLTFSNNV